MSLPGSKDMIRRYCDKFSQGSGVNIRCGVEETDRLCEVSKPILV